MTALTPLPALAQSALETPPYRSDKLQLAEQHEAALLRVRSLQDLPADGGPFSGWPNRTGQCVGDDPSVLCLRPREWLLISERLNPEALLTRVQGDVDPAETAVYDQSDGLAVFRLSGPAAPWLLAKIGALDFLAASAGVAHCARTRLGQIAVVVHYRGPQHRDFELVVDRSLARYLWELLTDAAPHASELAHREWRAAGDTA